VVTARDDELRVSEFRLRGRDVVGMEGREIGGRLSGTVAERLQKVLRLVFELIEIRADGRVRQYDEPP
jgi:hypothetical protein